VSEEGNAKEAGGGAKVAEGDNAAEGGGAKEAGAEGVAMECTKSEAESNKESGVEIKEVWKSM